jgi:serine/threonine protein phosphatase PrpC
MALLKSPDLSKLSSLYEFKTCTVASVGCQGIRPEMEDSDVVCALHEAKGHLFMGIFDGHGGSGASTFVAKQIVACLVATPSWKRYIKGHATCIADLGESMKETLENVDLILESHQKVGHGLKAGSDGVIGVGMGQEYSNSETKHQYLDKSGTTACIAIVTPSVIVCANVGDSRCILAMDGSFTKEMSFDQKPENAKERERIVTAGGKVHSGRIDGELGVARALGDFRFKVNGKVTNLPDISVHPRQPNDDFLVIACDGLWDVLSSSEVLSVIYESFDACPDKSLTDVVSELIDLGIARGSKDNISCILARFHTRMQSSSLLPPPPAP